MRRHPTIYSKKPYLRPPTSLIVYQVAALPEGTSSLDLVWVNGDPTRYTEIWFTNGQGRGYAAPGATTWRDTGLSPGLGYVYKIRHVDAGALNPSGYSNEYGALTQMAFNSPTNVAVYQVAALPAGTSSLRVTWTNAQADTVRIWFTTGGAWTHVGDWPAGTTEITHGGLAANTTYTYIVRHYRAGYETTDVAGNNAWGTTQQAFGQPVGLTVSVVNALPAGSSQLQLAWTAPNAIDYVQVFRNGVFLLNLNPGTASYLDTGLAANTQYYYQLQGYRLTDNYYFTGLGTAVYGTTQVALNPPVLNEVRSVAFPAGITQLQLFWSNAVATDGVRIYRNGVYVTDTQPGIASYLDGGLAGGTAYSYTLYHWRVTDNTYFSAGSNTLSNTTVADLPKPVWSNVYVPEAPGGMSQVMLQWYDPGAIHYTHIYILRDGVTAMFPGAGTTAYLDTGLNPNQSYSYQIAFHDSPTGYVGPWSDVAARTTLDHLRFYADYYNYAGQNWDITTSQPMFVAPGPVQGHFNRSGRVNWYAAAGGGGGGGGRADFTLALGGGGSGGGSGGSHPGGTLGFVVTAGFSYYFEVGGGGGGGAGNASDTTSPGNGADGGRSIIQQHNGVDWAVFLSLGGGGGGLPGTTLHRPGGGVGGSANVGYRGGAGGYGGATESTPPTGGTSEWSGANSGGGGGGGANYQLGEGSGGPAYNGGGGGGPGLAGATSGGYGGQPGVGNADPRGGGGGGGAGLWGPYSGGGGGGGGVVVLQSTSYRGGDGGAGYSGFVIIQNGE